MRPPLTLILEMAGAALIILAMSTGGGFATQAANINELFAELLRARGFNCPMVESATSQGVDAYGKVVKMWCGQGDKRGNPIYFRVTEVGTKPNVDYRIEPWHD